MAEPLFSPPPPYAEPIGPIAIRTITLAATCEVCVSHEHTYDHVTLVIAGRVRVTAQETLDGPEMDLGVFGPGESVVILARRHHTVKALEPSTYACIYSHRDLNGVVVQTYDASMNPHIYG